MAEFGSVISIAVRVAAGLFSHRVTRGVENVHTAKAHSDSAVSGLCLAMLTSRARLQGLTHVLDNRVPSYSSAPQDLVATLLKRSIFITHEEGTVNKGSSTDVLGDHAISEPVGGHGLPSYGGQ